MSRLTNRLTAIKVEKLKKPGLHPDGSGLYLNIGPAGTKSWVFRFMLDHRARHMGLGPFPLISLAEARQKAQDARRLRYEGTDPIEARRLQQASKRLDAAKHITVQQAGEQYIAAHRSSWKHINHTKQWEISLGNYVYPMIGALPVAAIDTALVMKVLEPIWTAKPETASRVRGRIESILDWARVRGYRPDGENPARWRGHLDKLLPKKSKVKKSSHYAAMPYPDLPAFMVRLKEEEGGAARALEFLILTASRIGEVAGATWDEIKGDTWVIPGSRMKGGREHRVPLSPVALAIIEQQRPVSIDNLVFPGLGTDGERARLLLRPMGVAVTVHGFRSTFRDWAAEATATPNHVVEMALAHAIGNAVEASYRRGDLFEKRRELMEAWARYCSTSMHAAG